jgi:hypothetical protein
MKLFNAAKAARMFGAESNIAYALCADLQLAGAGLVVVKQEPPSIEVKQEADEVEIIEVD